MSCDCGWFASVDFLYWYANETDLAYAAQLTAVDAGTVEVAPGPTAPAVFSDISKLEYAGGGWDPGVRLGLGLNNLCDGWDLGIFWTWYHNEDKESRTGSAGTVTFPQNPGEIVYTSPWQSRKGTRVFTTVSGKWEFTLNALSLELGKRYYLSKCFTLRPYTSIRGMWTKTEFTATASRPATTSNPGTGNPSQDSASFTDEFTNKFYGGGMGLGLEPTWFITPCFSIFAGAEVALLWGKHKVKKDATGVQTRVDSAPNVGDQNISYMSSSSSKNSYMTPVLDVSLGLRWENYYCDYRYHLAIDLGWEHHNLFHLNDRYVTGPIAGENDGVNGDFQVVSDFTQTSHDVSFGGLVLRVRFGF